MLGRVDDADSSFTPRSSDTTAVKIPGEDIYSPQRQIDYRLFHALYFTIRTHRQWLTRNGFSRPNDNEWSQYRRGGNDKSRKTKRGA